MCYNAKDVDDLKSKLNNVYYQKRTLIKFYVFTKIIGDKKFLGGDEPCALDFYFADICE